jgi:hypothetical protein
LQSVERLLSAAKFIAPGGTTSSIAAIVSSKRIPKFGSCQPTAGRATVRSRNRRSSWI